jgi:hypothetical protein
MIALAPNLHLNLSSTLHNFWTKIRERSKLQPFFIGILVAIMLLPLTASASLFLKERLSQAQPGQYVVTAHRNHYTLLHIQEKDPRTLVIEEITIPAHRVPSSGFSWKQWVADEAPGHTHWVLYRVDMDMGKIVQTYSLMTHRWLSVTSQENYLPTLLSLEFTHLPINRRKSITYLAEMGSAGRNIPWQPRLVKEGEIISGVSFEAWSAVWPQDQGELSGKTIEIYLPVDQDAYISYFPYWLQIKGSLGKAVIRAIDSGSNLVSSTPALSTINE